MQTAKAAQMIMSPMEKRGHAEVIISKLIVDILEKHALGLEVAHLVSTVWDHLALMIDLSISPGLSTILGVLRPYWRFAE
jgi:hypothetical protein